jgi:hypothetical protein
LFQHVGRILAIEFVAQHRFDLGNLKRTHFIGKGDGCAGGACPAGSADAVNIMFGFKRHVIVDHVTDVFHVQSPGRHIGCHKYRDGTVFELVQHLEPVVLGYVPGQDLAFLAVSAQFVAKKSGRVLAVDKNEDPVTLFSLQQVVDMLKFFVFRGQINDLPDAVCRCLFRVDFDPDPVFVVQASARRSTSSVRVAEKKRVWRLSLCGVM